MATEVEEPTEMFEWEAWDGDPCDAGTVNALARLVVADLVRNPRNTVSTARTGDSILVAARDEDGSIEIRWCMVRRTATVRP